MCIRDRLGMVSEIFTPKALEKLPNGKIAVGHVRYTSSESLDRASVSYTHLDVYKRQVYLQCKKQYFN